MSQDAKIRSLRLDGAVGRLEALLNTGSAQPEYAAVVCHPHPLFGGTMHNKVVFHAMKALNGFGFPVLRFNFRGVGTSVGEHDQGRGESDDVRTALDWLKQEFGLPIIFAGFSFGAAIGLRAACPDDAVQALISLGTPVLAEGRAYRYDYLRTCAKPKLFLSSDHDEHAPKERLEKLMSDVAEPRQLVLIEGGDHFFAGHLLEMRAAIEQWIRDVIKPREAVTL
ncbi:MAG TPA: alpha/beta fold hydrolase [Clostridia bacterium]|nr:alpha/beta fold hydrolase [Clostridia bacterium]